MQKDKFLNAIDNDKIIGSDDLDSIIDNYPYFQLAMALKLKSLKHLRSKKYNGFLKKTAAVTVDRSVLFYYISNFNNEVVEEEEIVEVLVEKETLVEEEDGIMLISISI